MKPAFYTIFTMFLLSGISWGQTTNFITSSGQVSLTWKSIPNNPYTVLSSTVLKSPAFSNHTPDGLIFSNSVGHFEKEMTSAQEFFSVAGSKYIVIDISGGASASNYPILFTNSPPLGGWTNTHKTDNIVLTRIPAATFIMGSPTNEVGRDVIVADERQHQVTLSQDLYMGIFEITQAQWANIMGTWPSYFTNTTCRVTRPVEHISYDNIRGISVGSLWPQSSNVLASSFIGQLRQKTGLYIDLPTEAQWEYACRATTTSAINNGLNLTNELVDSMLTAICNYYSEEYNWILFNQNVDCSMGTQTVGTYSPNEWGLYNMHGNVEEWCLDWSNDYDLTPAIDPLGPYNLDLSLSSRVSRGGNWTAAACTCRSAFRYAMPPSTAANNRGLRLVISK